MTEEQYAQIIREIEDYLLVEVDLGFYDRINGWIDSMLSYIEKETGHRFIADTTASPRSFDGNDTRFLPIDECIEITKVEKGSDRWGDTKETITDGYIELPQNHAEKGLPIDELMLKDSYWLCGTMNHTITAKWGYSEELPEDIKLALVILTAGIIYESLTGEGEVASEKIGEYSVTYKSDKEWADFDRAKSIIGQYKKLLL